MALSAQDVARINAALDAAKASRKCLSCGSRDIPLNPEMLGILDDHRLVCAGRDRTLWRGESISQRAVADALAAAGVPGR